MTLADIMPSHPYPPTPSRLVIYLSSANKAKHENVTCGRVGGGLASATGVSPRSIKRVRIH